MSTLGFLLRNLRYHWRANLAVLLGMTLGTAVLTGALFVGDSLRGSLRGLALDQIGWVDQALLGNRFFGADLVDQVEAKHKAPLLLLRGSVRDLNAKEGTPAAGITIYGVTPDFWVDPVNLTRNLPEGTDAAFWTDGAGIVLNATVARELGVAKGGRVELLLAGSEEMPRESLLGKREANDVLKRIRVDVKAVTPDEGMAIFSLKPSPLTPRNVFLPLPFLGKELDLAGKANAILAAGEVGKLKPRLSDWGYAITTPHERASDWERFITDRPRKDRLSEEECQAIIEGYPKAHPYLNLQGSRGVIEPAVANAIAKLVHLPASPLASESPLAPDSRPSFEGLPVLVYLADTIQAGKAEVPYAVVAAVPELPDPKKPGTMLPLKGDDAYLMSWPESPFDKEGKSIDVIYFVPDARNELEKKNATFNVKATLPIEGPLDDPFWTPPFPGITNKLSINDWDPLPFIDLARVRRYDDVEFKRTKKKPLEEYWKRYKTTPRLFISLEKGQELWGTRFGKLSSVRVTPSKKTGGMGAAAQNLERELVNELDPEAGGFVFQNIKGQALTSGGGSTDFGIYFLAFSFVLIVAALLLVGLLVRLNLERRAPEMGILLATGWSHRKVRRIHLGEGAILAALGGALGLAGAVGYTTLLLDYLRANWPAENGLSFLHLHTSPTSMAIGWSASVLAGLLTLLWATHVLGKMQPTTLLRGGSAFTGAQASSASRWSPRVMWISLVGATAAFGAGWFVKGHEAKAGTFFGCGALILTAALAFLWQRLGRESRTSEPQPTLTMLGIRNAARYRLRSVLTIGLLASATFLIVAVESFHKETGNDFYYKDHGSGGFTLVAETDVPLFQDLNEKNTRLQLDIRSGDEPLWHDAKFFALRIRGGDDTSCLNLYQPLQPRLLGAGKTFRERGGFAFGATLAESAEEKANPWLLLGKKNTDGNIAAFVDATSAQYILKVGLGGIVEAASESGSPVKLRIVGLLQDSIFQSEVVLADEDFTRIFPHQEGFNFFLIECPVDKMSQTQEALQRTLGEHGFRVQTTRERVQSYLAVENTYLATFQALGGLGLLLGALGLAIVLLRGVWERRGELALLQALGFRKSALAWLVLVENVYLLALGLAAGAVAALLAVAPHLAQAGAGVLWGRILLLLTLVAAVGLAAGTAAVAASLRTPILTALRRE